MILQKTRPPTFEFPGGCVFLRVCVFQGKPTDHDQLLLASPFLAAPPHAQLTPKIASKTARRTISPPLPKKKQSMTPPGPTILVCCKGHQTKHRHFWQVPSPKKKESDTLQDPNYTQNSPKTPPRSRFHPLPPKKKKRERKRHPRTRSSSSGASTCGSTATSWPRLWCRGPWSAGAAAAGPGSQAQRSSRSLGSPFFGGLPPFCPLFVLFFFGGGGWYCCSTLLIF